MVAILFVFLSFYFCNNKVRQEKREVMSSLDGCVLGLFGWLLFTFAITQTREEKRGSGFLSPFYFCDYKKEENKKRTVIYMFSSSSFFYFCNIKRGKEREKNCEVKLREIKP